MNYLTEPRKNALASEYALGTLHGGARTRFQALLMQHRALRSTLWRWESKLNTLGASLPPVSPDSSLWQRISEQLGFDNPHNADVVTLRSDATVPTAKNTARRWQWIAGGASLAAAVLAIALLLPVFSPDRISPPTTPAQVAIVQSEKAQALWLIEIDGDNINVQATDRLTPQPNNDYQLWLVASDGRAPVSLGILPKQGSGQLQRIALVDQVDIAALAVSLEPLGGSPNGQPTTVLYTAELVTL